MSYSYILYIKSVWHHKPQRKCGSERGFNFRKKIFLTQYFSRISQAIFIHGDPTLFNIHETFIESLSFRYLYILWRIFLWHFNHIRICFPILFYYIDHCRGATGAARAPKPGKTSIMAARRRCRCLLFFKIEVRPRSCRSYHIWRP